MYVKAFLILLAVSTFTLAQSQPATTVKPTPVETPAPRKMNERPAPTPAPATGFAAEPFDKADVKTMASQCVTFDTDAGTILMEVYPESAPESVRNFLNLSATGLFDNTTFSRVVPNFVIQGGDLSTAGKWTNALALRARRSVPDEPNAILHERGVLSMARGEEPNSASTHFFILLTDAPYLDKKFAAFGRVLKGIEVVEAINKASVFEEKPDKPVRIKKATVAACAAPTP